MAPPQAKKTTRSDRKKILEEHVAFELSRWSGEQIDTFIRDDVDALFDWLGEATVADLLPAESTATTIAAILDDLEPTDQSVALLAEALIAGRAALLGSEAVLADVVDPQDLHALADRLAHMDELRGRAIAAVTDSPAYHELVAHVLYHGVKAFVLTENVFARRLPGAQSLIRMGQRGLQSAAPGLEDGVDRQLRKFVQSQIGDTLSDSKRFLDRTLTGDSVHELVDTTWRTAGPARLSRLAEAVEDDDIAALTEDVIPLARALLQSGLLSELTTAAVEEVLTAYADAEVATLLADLGVDRDELVTRITELATPAIDHARTTGFLEQRIRARLEPFYLG